MQIYAKEHVVLAKIETTYGTDPSPVGGDGMVVYDFSVNPMEGEDEERDLDLPDMAASGTIPNGLHAKVKFKVEMAGSGTPGTPPAWSAFMRACGVAETITATTSVDYTPVGSGHESAALYYWKGTTLQKLLGMRGTVMFDFTSQKRPFLEFDMTALYAEPEEEAVVEPSSLGLFQRPLAVGLINTPAFTIDDVDLPMRMTKFTLANTVEARLLVNLEEVRITGRRPLIEATVDAVPLGTFNPFEKAASAEGVPLILRHGREAGNIVRLRADNCQILRVPELAENQNQVEWPLTLRPRGNGTDEWSLLLT
ncbi:hypothetical protein [Thalassococcus sp. S3]|uniref:hypothetical protein n=1 Tax=Thalassococcus sp. S3 TaxID=2017482 RepID=UPI0010242F82|nr:hypothetical protein [Thalassococcus sp. S3]QBF31494.1 hypothetical protein CFI11_09735 [Thalassococcus sp. S3]